MKWFAETTDYQDSVPNGIYLLDDGKTKMYAFKPKGTDEIKVFKNSIRIETRGRKFAVNPVQFETAFREPEPKGRVIEVQGSKGDVYKVTELNGNYSCSCSGFKFRGECRHTKEVQNESNKVQ
jgi:hypothetical protein